MEFACLRVRVYVPAHSSVTKHDERTSICWQIIDILWEQQATLGHGDSVSGLGGYISL